VLLAGALHLSDVLKKMSVSRPVFHSEADFQHAFAWTAHELDPSLQVRLETRPEPHVRLDLLLFRPDLQQFSAIELKYLTTAWSGDVGGETFALKSQGAQDIRAYDVVKDIHRVERFVKGGAGLNGAVVVLTNEPSYWQRPSHTIETNATAFRLYEATVLSGRRSWGPQTGVGTMKGREVALDLVDEYACTWSDYSTVGGVRGRFRHLTFEVSS